jgi:hypothetical protein
MPWTTLSPTGSFVNAYTLPKTDPYLAWVDATGFADFARRGQAVPVTVPALVELADGKTPADLNNSAAGRDSVRPIYRALNTRYCTADFTPQACLHFSDPRNGIVERFEFAMPVLPQRAPPVSRPLATAPPAGSRETAATNVLLGVIDSGCAFAHASFRRGGNSRIVDLWDQDAHPAFGAAPAVGGVPADFGYGREVNRSMLNALLATCTLGGGTIDEDASYELADYPELRRRTTHAAHVLDRLAGPRRLGSRISTTPDKPPTWNLDHGCAASADLVFVELPRDTWADPAGNALPVNILDGLRYILSCRKPGTTKVVVNASMSAYTGPHNGSSIFELAVADLVLEQSRLKPCVELLICLPTGNSFQSRWHAERTFLAAGASASTTMRVSPGSETPTIAQMWCSGGPVQITITAPDGASTVLRPGDSQIYAMPNGAIATAVFTSSLFRGYADSSWCHADSSSKKASSMLLLAIAPTDVSEPLRARAMYGDWLVKVDAVIAANLRMYVADNQTEFAPPRGRPARLIQPDYDPDRYLRERDEDSGTVPPGFFEVQRRGSIAGTATGGAVRAVAGYRLRQSLRAVPGYGALQPVLTPAEYSSSGPPVPHCAAPTEESWALPGFPGAGTRSACVVRMSGTSFASPQFARALTDKLATGPKPQPADPDRWGSDDRVLP